MPQFSNRFKSQLNYDIQNAINPTIPPYIFTNYSSILTQNELKQLEIDFFHLVKFLIDNDKCIFPENYGKKIYRVTKLGRNDIHNDYYPLGKSVISNCPIHGTPQEPTWYSIEPLYQYLNLTDQNQYGLISCRNIKNIDIQNNRFNLFVDYSSYRLEGCSNQRVQYISKRLQYYINKVILIIIVRMYTDLYNYQGDLSYDFIIQNAEYIKLTKTVNGYNCDDKYQGNTIASLLESWNYKDGTRKSFYNEDRIHSQVLFEIFEYIEYYINQSDYIFDTNYIELIRNEGYPTLPNNTKINLIGWVCDNAPTIKNHCNYFPGEWVIHMKYFKFPLRYSIFDKIDSNCGPTFVKYDQNPPGYIEINENELPEWNSITNRFDPNAMEVDNPNAMEVGGKVNVINNNHNLLQNAPQPLRKSNKTYKPKVDIFVNKPENKESDLYKVFIHDPKEELYTHEPESISNIIKKLENKNRRQQRSRSATKRSATTKLSATTKRSATKKNTSSVVIS
jgi:hypothetical protein